MRWEAGMRGHPASVDGRRLQIAWTARGMRFRPSSRLLEQLWQAGPPPALRLQRSAWPGSGSHAPFPSLALPALPCLAIASASRHAVPAGDEEGAGEEEVEVEVERDAVPGFGLRHAISPLAGHSGAPSEPVRRHGRAGAVVSCAAPCFSCRPQALGRARSSQPRRRCRPCLRLLPASWAR